MAIVPPAIMSTSASAASAPALEPVNGNGPGGGGGVGAIVVVVVVVVVARMVTDEGATTLVVAVAWTGVPFVVDAVAVFG